MTCEEAWLHLFVDEYPCDDNGKNCAMKYQDQVESNIPFADWKHKRNVNNRRPVLGRAEEWKKLGCQANTKIETIDFSEFVVRLDCPAYSEDDLIEAGDTAPNEYFNYPSCQLGFKANSATTYMHNDRTDPSRMRNSKEYGDNQTAGTATALRRSCAKIIFGCEVDGTIAKQTPSCPKDNKEM